MVVADVPAIGRAVKAAREARGLSQQAASSAAKISMGALGELERGGNARLGTLLKIANYLGLELRLGGPT